MKRCSKFGSAFLQLFTVLAVAGTLIPASAQYARPAEDAALSEAERDVEAGRLDEALAKCREILKVDPESARAYYLIGNIALQRGEQDQAKQALLQSIKLDPSPIVTHLDLGRAYLLSKQWHAAEQEFQTARKLGDTTGDSEFGLGLALAGESRPSEALPHLARAVRSDPKDSERLFTLIAAELQVKQVANAKRHLAQMEKLSLRDPFLFYRAGNLLKDQQILDEAEAMFKRSAELVGGGESNPAHPLSTSDLSLAIARLRFERHDYAGALQSLEKFEPARAAPEAQAAALEVEGEVLLADGKAAQAQERLRRAANLDPSRPDHFFHWAWAALMAGDIEEGTRVASVAKSRWPQAPEGGFLFAVLERERMPARARVPYAADWRLKGEGMVCCPCAVPCPCRSNGPPTHQRCENTGVFGIAQGHYGDISLGGFTFAVVEAAMGQEGIPTSLYVDSSASDEELIALERIFQSFEPTRPFLFLDVKRVPLALVRPDEKTYQVNVPGLFEIKIRRELDDKGKPLLQTAALDYFSNRLEYARNLIYKAWGPDGSLRWDYSGRQANYRTVDLAARDYRERRMLAQFRDGSGFFNKKQLELIKSLKLPILPSYPQATNGASNRTCTGQ